MSELLIYPIARDVRARIEFTGTVTQEGVQKLIDILECERDTFPTGEKEMGTPAAKPECPSELLTADSVAHPAPEVTAHVGEANQHQPYPSRH